MAKKQIVLYIKDGVDFKDGFVKGTKWEEEKANRFKGVQCWICQDGRVKGSMTVEKVTYAEAGAEIDGSEVPKAGFYLEVGGDFVKAPKKFTAKKFSEIKVMDMASKMGANGAEEADAGEDQEDNEETKKKSSKTSKKEKKVNKEKEAEVKEDEAVEVEDKKEDVKEDAEVKDSKKSKKAKLLKSLQGKCAAAGVKGIKGKKPAELQAMLDALKEDKPKLKPKDKEKTKVKKESEKKETVTKKTKSKEKELKAADGFDFIEGSKKKQRYDKKNMSGVVFDIVKGIKSTTVEKINEKIAKLVAKGGCKIKKKKNYDKEINRRISYLKYTIGYDIEFKGGKITNNTK